MGSFKALLPTFSSWVILLLLNTTSIGMTTKKCQLFKKDFQGFTLTDVSMCPDEFGKRDFMAIAICKQSKDIISDMKNIPDETDAMCFFQINGIFRPGGLSRFYNLTAVYIKNSFHFMPGAFEGLRHLSLLWIYIYKNITFNMDALTGLYSLKELYIMGIHFSQLNWTVLSTLIHLEILSLNYNEITNLSDVTKHLSTLSALRNLSLFSNNIEVINKDDCLSLSTRMQPFFLPLNVSYLDLSTNRLEKIEKHALCDFPYLSFLKADISSLNIKDLFNAGIQRIDVLSLQRIGLDNNFPVCSMVQHFQIQQLLLNHNGISELNITEIQLKTLKRLDLTENYLTSLTSDLIYTFANVKELIASENAISFLELCPNDTKQIIKLELTCLALSSNDIQLIKNGQFFCLKNLQTLLLNDNKITQVEDSAFIGLDSLKLLNLEGNAIFQINMDTFNGLNQLTKLNLYQNKLKEIHAMAFYQTNKLQELKISLADDVQHLYCFGEVKAHLYKVSIKTFGSQIWLEDELLFPFMHSLEVLEVEALEVVLGCDTFPFSQIEELYIWKNCLFVCLTGLPALEYFTNLRLLHYSSSQDEIHTESQLNSTIPYLHSLENLYLEDIYRDIQRSLIDAEVLFYGLDKLQTLHLKNSGITHFTVNMFKDLRSLHGLIVEQQTIIVLQYGIFNSLEKLEYIYFHDVDFKCNCEMHWIIEWLATNIHVQVFDFSLQNCSTQEIEFNFLDFLDTQCPPVLEFTLFMLTFCITLSFILFTLLHESIWWNLLYLYYLVRERLNSRISRRHGDKYQYDAFVSYSSYDEEWVVNQLLPNLEQTGPSFVTLCLHNRDFELGKNIVDNIMDNIQKSRWTICIVTHNYLQSQWCSLEMKMTTYRLIAESRDCLLLILLEKISLEEISYYHRLARLMTKKTYLDWPLEKKDQQLFWAKLKNAILKPTENKIN